MTNTEVATRQFGRCTSTGCRTRIVLDPALDSRVQVSKSFVTVDAPSRTELADNVFVNNQGLILCTAPHGDNARALVLRFTGLKAVHRDGIRCDAKCRNAVTADCECSCDGQFHGMSHV